MFHLRAGKFPMPNVSAILAVTASKTLPVFALNKKRAGLAAAAFFKRLAILAR